MNIHRFELTLLVLLVASMFVWKSAHAESTYHFYFSPGGDEVATQNVPKVLNENVENEPFRIDLCHWSDRCLSVGHQWQDCGSAHPSPSGNVQRSGARVLEHGLSLDGGRVCARGDLLQRTGLERSQASPAW